MKTVIMILTILSATAVMAEGQNCANGDGNHRKSNANENQQIVQNILGDRQSNENSGNPRGTR